MGTHVDRDEMNLGVTVLASLGGRHVDDFARTAWGSQRGRGLERWGDGTFDDDMTVFAESRALHGIRQGRICIRLWGGK